MPDLSFEKAVAASLISIIIGIIVGVMIEEVRQDLQSQPDFYISTGVPFKTAVSGANDSVKIYLHNINKNKKYRYPITVIAYETEYYENNTHPIQRKDVAIEPINTNRIIMLDKKECKIAYMKLEIGENTTGDRLIEFRAIGGDGKERFSHLVIKTDKQDKN
jgi:hypothetical protein